MVRLMAMFYNISPQGHVDVMRYFAYDTHIPNEFLNPTHDIAYMHLNMQYMTTFLKPLFQTINVRLLKDLDQKYNFEDRPLSVAILNDSLSKVYIVDGTMVYIPGHVKDKGRIIELLHKHKYLVLDATKKKHKV